MDNTTLVSIEIDRGWEVLHALERANIEVAVALWAYLSEYEDWRLILSARQFDSAGPRGAYRQVNNSLIASGVTPGKAPPVLILSMDDPFINELRRIYGQAKDVEGMRLGGQLIGDRFLQDAYAYRIS